MVDRDNEERSRQEDLAGRERRRGGSEPPPEQPLPDRDNAFSYTGKDYQTYQRGGSGSEGGLGEDQSYGPSDDLSERGGGTGIRENEREPERTSSGGGNERGSFAGRGPKDGRRPDERIREDVQERLTAHPEIEATQIEVSVQDSEVILAGTVEDPNAKQLAEDIAQNVAGVKDVRNNISVQRTDTR